MTDTDLRSGRWTAVVSDVGCTLREIGYDGRRLLSAPAAQDSSAGHHGAVLAPWPGRTADAHYRFDGTDRVLPVNEPAFGHALHGFVFDVRWQRVLVTADTVTHQTVIDHPPGYPGCVSLEITYALTEDGLRCESVWENLGAQTVPFGLGFHPYLAVGPDGIDDWVLHVPAAVSIDSIPETKRTAPSRPVEPGIDFAMPRRVGAERFSRAYGGLSRTDGFASARVSAADGFGLELRVDEGFRWLQVFTADLPSTTLARRGIAIEPQTCPPDAFNSGIDVHRLAPGDVGRATWSLHLTE